MGLGEYPPEFNPRIHGPYHPGRYYGKADTPLSQVKLGEMGSWLSRRSYTPQSMVSCVMRVVINSQFLMVACYLSAWYLTLLLKFYTLLSLSFSNPENVPSPEFLGYWRWATKYLLARKTSIAPLVQFTAGMATVYYFLQYRSHTNHRHAKYH